MGKTGKSVEREMRPGGVSNSVAWVDLELSVGEEAD